VRSLKKLREWRGKQMRFQTTLEGAECLRRSDAGWQSVPGTRRSDEERAVTNRRTTRRWCNKGQTSTKITASFLYPHPPHDVARSPVRRTMQTSKDENREFKLYRLWHPQPVKVPSDQRLWLLARHWVIGSGTRSQWRSLVISDYGSWPDTDSLQFWV